MRKLLLFLLLLPLAVFSAECVKLSEGLYRLENEFVKADITAVGGARCLSLVDKRTGLEYTSSHPEMGIGGECDWQEKKMKNSIWFGKPYAVLGTQKGDRAEIRLQRSGTGVVGQWITITKTYTLDDKSTEIEVLYDIAVRAEAMKTISFYPWLHNSVQLESEPVKMIFAKTSGINSINFKPNWPLNESFHYDMTDSWVAVSRLKHPSGVVLQTPYRDMMCFYNWQGEEGNTIEQMFHEQQIKAGTSYVAPMKLTFYSGLDTVDGADAGVVAQFIDGGVRIYAAYSDDAEVTASARKPPELIERTIGTESVKLQFGKTQDVHFQSMVPQGEELILRVKTSRGTMTMRKPFGIKDYKRPPVEKRRGRESDRFGMVFLKAESTKDCYDWPSELPVVNGNTLLKPDANGRLRILVVTDMIAGREAYELAGRMDAEVSSCTFSTNGHLKWHPQWGHSGGLPEANMFLEHKLKEDYDAIVFGGQQFSVLTEKNMEAIKTKVSNGTALITVTPRMVPKKYADMFPVTPQVDYILGAGKVALGDAKSFNVEADSPIKNFPYKSLGFVPLFPYAVQKASVTCGNGQPFFAMAPFGKGRVASFTWLNGLKENTTRAGIMPLFEDEPELPWHNVFYGMIIKATQAALGRSPKLAIRDFHADATTLKLTIDNTLDRMMNANCLLTVYHSCSSSDTRSLPVSLKPGVNEISLPMDISLSAMQSLVEIRLMADGLAFDFAYDAVDNPNGCVIEWKNKIDGPLLTNRQYALDFDFKGTYDKADAVLQDCHGRILATGIADGGRIALAPHGAVEHRAELTVRLHAAGRVVASRVFIVDLVPENELAREWDSYRIMLSWPVRDTRVMPFHLRSTWQKTLKNLGIDLVMTYGMPVGTGGDQPANYMLNYRYVGPLVMESITRFSKGSGIPGFNYPYFDYRHRKKEVADMLDKFAKTNDPATFKRYPRLDDDTYLKAYTAAMDKWIPSILQWRPFMFDLGDEMSYGQYGSPLDFDFSPEGLAMFRKWLRQRYNDDLARLNAEWQRDFKSWDDVMPDTGNEARTRGVYAGWALHRIYNTGVFANFWKVISDHARKMDPGVRISASGTPPANAYNGYDYEKLMPTVDSLIAYTLNGLAEVIASFKKAPLMSWVGYGSPEREVWREIWDNAFNGHYGVGFYSEMTMVNPNLTLTSHGATVRDAAKPLHDDGVGTLLFHCESTPTALIHYSVPSMLLSHVLKNYNAFALSHGYWVSILKERNCNPKFITPGGIMRGGLVSSSVKFLILPNSAALSDGEIAELRKFAAQGGHIIADTQPGVYNENCALAPEGRLKDVPVWMLGQNLVEDSNAPIMRKLSAHLDEIIPRRKMILTSKDGNPQIHSYRLCGEGGEVYGVWPSRPSVISVSNMEGITVYDVMGGKNVTGDGRLKENRPGVFVVLPYKVAGVDVSRTLGGAGATRALTIDASIRTDNGHEPLRHVLQFRIGDADGNELEYHRRTMNAPNGRARMTIHLAENEDSSKWTVKVTDMISKVSNN